MSPSDDTRDGSTPPTESICATCGAALDASGICPVCATSVRFASATVPELDVPRDLPDIPGYRVLSRLGEGGMGAVFLAEDLTLGRRVAIKMVSSRVAGDVPLRSRFAREARTLATIEHPHVVRVYTFGESGGTPYLVMEYVEGDTLSHRLARDGRFELGEALRITRQVARALGAAWQRHIVHRDIKPSNVLLDRENEVRVVDFGLAKPMHVEGSVGDASLTQSGYMLGTPHYISPEQAQGHDVDFRSDIYSLGIMLYHMIAGERPFDGATPVAIIAKHLQTPVPPLEPRIAGATKSVDGLIAWMTAKDPAARPQSYEELISAIDALRSPTPSQPLPTYSTVAVKSPAPPLSVRAIVAITLAGLAVVVIVGAIVGSGVARYFKRQAAAPAQGTLAVPNDGRFVVAVAPFYGPDSDSEKEGRVMAALIEQSVMQRLGPDKARVLGIDKTKEAVRDHDSARALGEKLGAHAVIWGEAFALRQETEIQPHVTMVRQKEKSGEPQDGSSPVRNERATLAMIRASTTDASNEDRGGGSVKLQAEAPNQIEMRKTSASGIGDLVVFVAGIHALDAGDAKTALDYFRQSPPSPESMRFQADALIQLERNDEARAILEKAVVADPKHVASRALLGDLQIDAKDYAAAAASYAAADASGQPYTTTRGVLSGGKLYTSETYKSLYYGTHHSTPGGTVLEEITTLSLLTIDPSSGRVLQRQLLPGPPMKFERSGDSIAITINARGGDDPLPFVLHLAQGKLDRQVWPPPNLLYRMRTSKAGRVLAANFVQEGVEGVRTIDKPIHPRFAVSTAADAEIDRALPMTLPDLERALRSDIDRDPTNPWAQFYLGLVLRTENRVAEGEAVWSGILTRDWSVGYWEFSWIAEKCERLRLPDWSARFAEKAIAERKKIPLPVTFTTLIERLINGSFVRGAALNFEGVDGYRALQQSRNLTGYCFEGDDAASAAWARWFDAHGRSADAARERALLARARRSPLNLATLARAGDVALALLVGSTAAFLYAIAATLLLALSRARRGSAGARSPVGWTWLEKYAGRRARISVATFVIAAATLLLTYSIIEGEWIYAAPAVVIAILSLLGAFMRTTAPQSILYEIDRRERIAVAIGLAVTILSLGATYSAASRIAVLSSLPIGIPDAVGHPRILHDLEERLKQFPNNHDLQYLAAVAAHYGGETDTARSLYRSAGGPKAAANLKALEARQLPVVPLTDVDWLRAFSGSWAERLKDLHDLGENYDLPVAISQPGFVAMILLAIAILFGRGTRREPSSRRDSRLMRALMLVVPGMWDARRGSMIRAILIVFGLAFCVLPLLFMQQKATFVLGPISLRAVPDILTAYPVPDAQHGFRPLMMDAAFSDPVVVAFLALVALLGVIAIVLHVSRFPQILRRVDATADAQSTIVTPTPTATGE